MVQPVTPIPLFRWMLVACLGATLAFGPTARAKIVPEFDAKTERSWPTAKILKSSGWWTTSQVMDGGTLRLRGSLGRTAEVSVLFRGTLKGDEPEAGYRVRITKGQLHLERIEGDSVTPLADPEDIRRPSRGELELLVTHVGPHLAARLYRVKSSRHLGSVFATDATHARGVSGVHLGSRSKKRISLERFSTRRACRGTPIHTGERGRTIWATLAEEPAKQLKRVKLRPMERLPGEPRRTVYRFDTIDLERAVCQGVPLERLSLETPWKYLDKSYRGGRSARWKLDQRVDLAESYKNPEMAIKLLKRWAKAFPDQTHLERIGRSRQGRPIYALAIGDDPRPGGDAPTLLLNGAHHGNEPISVDFVLEAADAMLHADPDSDLKSWLRARTVWVVPVVNPDGLHAFLEVTSRTGRKNGHDHDRDGDRERLEGIDLNRNYPFQWGSLGEKGSRSRPTSVYYRGASASSEPEVKAMVALSEREQFSAAISYHTGTVAILAPYTIPGVENPGINEAWAVAEEMVAIMPMHAQDREFTLKKNLYPVDGTDQDWHRFANGTVALLVEGARTTPRTARKRRRVLESVAPAWRFLLERFTTGRLLDVRVRDRQGRGVQAEVIVHGMEPQAGERWLTRCPTGRALRAVPRAGSWKVEVRSSGAEPLIRTVEVADGPVEVNVVVDNPVATELCEGAASQPGASP